ncbi:porin [Agarivorans sp. OAG1]|uniref:porin n=1 Tax=unclassified Agarivorans TaxID=2636026 RepID=UPI00128D7F00|nr:porin [Agarivorans sp. B2Z047]MPW29400.1 porin [Agarivorans sp. B2Z047]UQN44990.1 porin [Agarivorans sp. B2Z047]BEU03681.1 porin [Agarivorans sp. OAG1]
MNKVIAGLALSAMAGSVSAATIYENGKTNVSIGGYLGIEAFYQAGYGDKDKSFELQDRASRIRFAFEHEMVQNWIAGAQLEWGFNPVEKADPLFTNRLGNIYFNNDSFGSIRVGKQWSAYYDIAVWTDQFWKFGGDASGTYDGRNGGDESGMGRADDALTYRKSFGGFGLAAQYQFENDSSARDYGYQLSGTYDFDFGLSIGAAYAANGYDVKNVNYVGADDQDKATSWLAGAVYESDMFYASGVYGEYENLSGKFSTLADKANGLELIGVYKIDGGLYHVYAGYNGLEDKTSGSQGELSYALAGVGWKPGQVLLALEYKFGLENKDALGADKKQDEMSIQARYYF